MVKFTLPLVSHAYGNIKRTLKLSANTHNRYKNSMSAITNLSIIYKSPYDLRPDPRNARTHPKKQVAQIKASIESFGFTNPVLIDEENLIIAGHGRLLAAKEIGLREVPTIEVAGLSSAQQRALRLADNKIALGASWDLDVLKIELGELLEMNVDLSLTGFSVGEIDVVLSQTPDPDDETLPDISAEPRVSIGDIWQLGDHRIGCGDSGDLAFVQAVMGDGVQADAAFLDPPYNVAIGGHAVSAGTHREFAMASGEMTSAEFEVFLKETLSSCVAVSRSGAVHFICMDWRHMDELSSVGKQVYGDLLNICIWNKSNAGMGSL